MHERACGVTMSATGVARIRDDHVHAHRARRISATAGAARRQRSALDFAATATIYVCGSTGFADHVTDLLIGVGMPSDTIRVERFGPTTSA
jgi:ferredoxin-NADP reductase